MSLITFNSGHTFPEANIDRIDPTITVTRKTSLIVSQPDEVTAGGVAIQAHLFTELVVDIDHVLYPKTAGKKDAEGIVVSRNPGVIKKTLSGVALADALAGNDAVKAEAVKHLRKLNEYYTALGALQAPIPADNSLIGEVAGTGSSQAKLEANIASRTKKLEAVLEAAEITGEVTSEPMTDVYEFLDTCAEKGYDVDRNEVLSALLQPPVDNVISGSVVGETQIAA